MNYYNRNYINRLRRNAHSPENSSDEWAFFFLHIRFTSVVTQIAIKSWIKTHLIFSKIFEVRGTKMKKIQKNYELNAGESFRLDKNGLHGVTAQGRFKMSLLRVFNKSSMLKHRTKAGMRGKHRR